MMTEAPHHYGTTPEFSTSKTKPRAPINWAGVIGSLFVPWLIFVFTWTLLCSTVRYDSEAFASTICYVFLAIVLTFGYMTYQAFRNGQDTYWLGFLFVTSLIWWMLAGTCGDKNFYDNWQPFYDIGSLNVYPSVDPNKTVGNQLMDAGIIKFTDDAYIYLPLSMSFVNKETYCAAPIVKGPPNSTLPEQFDFWAIGKNCCSGHIGDFRCGEYSNAAAHSGLRLMNDGDRQFYRLVVQQAEAAFNIRARHPLYLYWMQRPEDEIAAYQDDGMTRTSFAIFGVLFAQLVLTALAVLVYTKL